VLGKQTTAAKRSTVAGMSDKQVHTASVYYTDPKVQALVNALAAVIVLPDGLSRDGTGRVHGDLPDRISDDWSRARY
jgi:hypothetical protein